MKKATESPANRRMIEGRRDVPLYSEDHGAEGKSSNSEEGKDGEESMQLLEGCFSDVWMLELKPKCIRRYV